MLLCSGTVDPNLSARKGNQNGPENARCRADLWQKRHSRVAKRWSSTGIDVVLLVCAAEGLFCGLVNYGLGCWRGFGHGKLTSWHLGGHWLFMSVCSRIGGV